MIFHSYVSLPEGNQVVTIVYSTLISSCNLGPLSFEPPKNGANNWGLSPGNVRTFRSNMKRRFRWHIMGVSSNVFNKKTEVIHGNSKSINIHINPHIHIIYILYIT